MNIRNYQKKDFNDVRNVCVNTADGVETEKQKELLWTVFCDYYINEEPDCCFVAADVNDKAQGYIIASADFKFYEKTFRDKYLPRLRKVKFFSAIEKSLELIFLHRYAKDYPAHLHIDINSDFQRMGLGHKLMDTLVLRLDEKCVKGVFLIVGKSNEKGVNFYKKYGFVHVSRLFEGIVFGLDVKAKAKELRSKHE